MEEAEEKFSEKQNPRQGFMVEYRRGGESNDESCAGKGCRRRPVATGGSAEEEMSLAELHNLARAAGVQVVRSFTQIRPQADKRYYIGPGKAQEIGAYAEENNIATVIFDSELSPSQVNNLERLIPAKIIDRSELILDIFAQRATSKASCR